MVLNPLWMMVNPYMGWRSINDPFYGHSCSNGVMVPRRRYSNPTGDVMMDLDPWKSPGVVEVVEESYESHCLMKNPLDPHLMA